MGRVRGFKPQRRRHNDVRGPVPISRAIIRQHLIDAGYSPDEIHEKLRELPDPVDFEQHGPLLEKLGITPGSLMDDLDAGP